MKNFKTDKSCVACGEQGENRVCLHHVKTRGSGGSNNSHNLMPLCQKHHNEIHQKGTPHMAKKYFLLGLWLISNGWNFDDYLGKWTHEKE
jgi:5-methylcytosine-specific restriction endonuclease McrA